MADWKPEGARELPADDWKPEGARVLAPEALPEHLKTGIAGDIGPGGTFGAHVARHLSFGMGDKILAGVNAVSDKLHDKTGKVTLADAYKRDLAYNDKAIDASDELHPEARWAGNAVGTVGSMAVPAGALRLMRGAPAALAATPKLLSLMKSGAKAGVPIGAVGGFGSSRGSLGSEAVDTGLGAAAGGVLGGVAPAVGEYAGRGAKYLGEKSKDFAGWLKVHSIHPNPLVGERMENLPGGHVGVGRELLEQGLGGMTKAGTAEQIAHAGDKASRAAGQLAEAYDSGGGAPVDVSNGIFRGANHAYKLQSEPTTRPAGQKLEQLVTDYAEKYKTGVAPAKEALRLKRALGDEAYGTKLALGSGDTLAGRYGEGVSEIQHGVDDSLDGALGPKFAEANLRVRRLLGAKQAAERSASRTQSNHMLGLIPMALGAGGYAAHGAEGGAAAALGSALLGKYGAQAGARLMYSPVGGGLNIASELAGPALSSAGAISPETAALVQALRRRSTEETE